MTSSTITSGILLHIARLNLPTPNPQWLSLHLSYTSVPFNRRLEVDFGPHIVPRSESELSEMRLSKLIVARRRFLAGEITESVVLLFCPSLARPGIF